jgi:hypothetical protein
MKKNIDELDILQVEEFQDYQVLDVVMFGTKYPDWQKFLPDMLCAIEYKLVTGDSDFELLCNAYEYAYIMLFNQKINLNINYGVIDSFELH